MNKTFKETTEEYNAKYMNKIQAELQEVLPHLAIGFVKQRMKHYNIDKRYLPPEFKGKVTATVPEVEAPANVPDA